MALNKKGMFFTVIALVIISLFALTTLFVSQSVTNNSERRRVETLNNFVSSVNNDFSRYVGISGYRILFILEKEIIENGNYVSYLNESVNELYFNETLNGVQQEIMIGASLRGMESTIREQAAKVNANFSIRDAQILIEQADPWKVKFTLSGNFVFEDLEGLVLWNTTEEISAFVPTENFNDPLYLINTGGLISNKIRKTPYENFISGSDASNLSVHVSGGYYIASSDAPSFLNRLQGVNSADEFGIESLVDLSRLASQGIPVEDKSVVDHIYFFSANPAHCSVNGMPSWFGLDNAHLDDYQAQQVAQC